MRNCMSGERTAMRERGTRIRAERELHAPRAFRVLRAFAPSRPALTASAPEAGIAPQRREVGVEAEPRRRDEPGIAHDALDQLERACRDHR